MIDQAADWTHAWVNYPIHLVVIQLHLWKQLILTSEGVFLSLSLAPFNLMPFP